MPLEDRIRERVDAEIERLRDRFGPFAVASETVTNEPSYFEHGRELAESGWLGDAGAFVTDEEGRAVFVRHENAPDQWGTPGGGHEPGETLAETARREVREETGLDCTLTDVYWARRKTIVHADESDRRIQILTVEFDADCEGGALAVDDDEILEARWLETPPDRVHEFLDARVEEWAGSE